MEYVVALLPLFGGWFLDLIFGDPVRLPHPIVGFGKMISFFEYRFNRGAHRRLKGGIVAVGLIVVVFCAAFFLLNAMPVALNGNRLLRVELRVLPVPFALIEQ